MKKAMYGIFILVLVGALAYGVVSTGAWFTDTATIQNNTVKTGSLDLEITTDGLSYDELLEPGADYVSVGGFCAKNVGNYDMKWRGWLTDVQDSNGLGNHIRVKVIINPPGSEDTNYGPTVGPNNVVIEDVPFNDLTNPNSGRMVMDDDTWAFGPGYKACYDIQVKLLASAKNAQQLSSLRADLFIEATQRINSGWAE